jgi:phosphatidate phosphatase LPIN
VTLHLNNSPDPLPFAMKVGEAGEAFFVLELDEDESREGIPDDLVTSPILSAASSPELSADSLELPGEDGMEALDLGASISAATAQEDAASAATTLPSQTTESAGVTQPTSRASSDAHFDGEKKGRDEPEQDETRPDDDSPGTLDVPPDSGATGSGPAGPSSVLGQVGAVVSKASGVIGGAGRSVVAPLTGGSNKLEKIRKAEQTGDDGSAPLAGGDGAGGAVPLESTSSSSGQRRMQAEDDATPPTEPPQADDTETDKLEMAMKRRAERLVGQARRRSSSPSGERDDTRGRQADSMLHADEQEEAYPSPFGATGGGVSSSQHSSESAGGAASASETRPAAQSDHSEFLAGRRLVPVASGLGTVQLSASQVEPRILKERLGHSPSASEQSTAGRDEQDDSATTSKTASRISGTKRKEGEHAPPCTSHTSKLTLP